MHLCIMKYLVNIIAPENSFSVKLQELLTMYPSADPNALGLKPDHPFTYGIENIFPEYKSLILSGGNVLVVFLILHLLYKNRYFVKIEVA